MLNADDSTSPLAGEHRKASGQCGRPGCGEPAWTRRPLTSWPLKQPRPSTAAAVAAAGLEQGEAFRAEITELGFEAVAVLVPESSPALADDALAALLIAAGPDGEWQQGWADAGTGLLARQTANQLASVFYRYQHRHDQELPLEY